MKMLIRFVISAVALWVAAEVFPGEDGGIRFTDDNLTTVKVVKQREDEGIEDNAGAKS